MWISSNEVRNYHYFHVFPTMIHFPLSNGFSQGALRYLVNNSLQSTVSLTSSGFFSGFTPSNVLTYSSYYRSETSSSFGQWIQMEFKEHKLDIEGYSLFYKNTNSCAQNWNFSVSSDGSNWIFIHSKANEDIKIGKTYESSSQNIRFFRWTQTSSNYGSNYMRISELDVFGFLFPINYTISASISSMEYFFLSKQCSVSTNIFTTILVIILSSNFEPSIFSIISK